MVGGAGGIGQPLSLLLKLDPNVTHVSVFDMVGAPGVAGVSSELERVSSSLACTARGWIGLTLARTRLLVFFCFPTPS